MPDRAVLEILLSGEGSAAPARTPTPRPERVPPPAGERRRRDPGEPVDEGPPTSEFAAFLKLLGATKSPLHILAAAALQAAAALAGLGKPKPAAPELEEYKPQQEFVRAQKLYKVEPEKPETTLDFEYNPKTGKYEQTQAVGFPNRGVGAPKASPEEIGRASIYQNAPKPEMLEAGAPEAAAIGMAELVPVVGAILLAFKKLKDETVSEVAALGELTQAIASADASISRPIEQLGDAAKSAADKIFLMNPAASVFIAAIGEATSQFGQLVGALDKTAKRYEEFSPELAVSSAMAEVRQTFGDLRRAQQVGPGLARFVDAQSRLQQRVEDLKADLLEKLLPAVVNILEALNRTVGGVDAGIQIMQAIADHGILTQADIRRILEKIKERDGARITEEMFRRIAAGQLADIQAMANLGQGFQEGGQ